MESWNLVGGEGYMIYSSSGLVGLGKTCGERFIDSKGTVSEHGPELSMTCLFNL